MLQSLALVHITLFPLPGKNRLSVGLELCKEASVGSSSSDHDNRYVWVQVSDLFLILAWQSREAWRWGVHLIELRGTKGQLWYHSFWQGEELKRITVTSSCHRVCFNLEFVWQAGWEKNKSIFYSRWQIYVFALSVISKGWNQHLITQPPYWKQKFLKKVYLLWRKGGKCNFPSSFLFLFSPPFTSRTWKIPPI